MPSFKSLFVRTMVIVAFAGVFGAVQASPAVGAPRQEAAGQRLREDILARFKVVPVSQGLVLVPISRIEGVESIELRDGTVALNGDAVTGAELRARLGRRADAVIELTYMSPEAQRRALGLTKPEAPAKPEPSVLPPVPPAPEIPPRREPRDEEVPDRTFQRHTDGRVRIGGDIRVEEDERVDGPVVAIFGSVEVNGRVSDDVVSVGGRVHLGPRAEIRGDVTAVGGGLSMDRGAIVSGQTNDVQFGFPNVRVRPVDHWPFAFPGRWGGPQWQGMRLVSSLLRMALFGLLAVAFVLLMPHAVRRIQDKVRFEPWKCVLTGLFAQLLFVPLLVILTVVLAVSIIGIPLLVLVPFAVLAFFVALLMGFAGAAGAFARGLLDRSGREATGALSMLVVGLALVWGITIVGRVISLAGGPVAWFAALILLTGFLVEYAAWTMGLGGALLTRFGRNGPGYVISPAPASSPMAPPPIPPVE